MTATSTVALPFERKLGLADRAYEALVSLILDGTLLPGQQLRVGQLAGMLGVSATPVREALVHLSASGLVVRENNKGFRVAEVPSAAELDDLFVARLTLEASIARLASVRADHTLIEGLNVALETQRRCDFGSPDGYRVFMDADRLFHRHLARASENRFLQSSLDVLDVHVLRYRSFDDLVVTDREETLDEHAHIVEAVASRSPRAAELAMTIHLTNLRERVRRERSQAGD